MKHRSDDNTALRYTNYSGRIMEEYGEKDRFDIELAIYPITELNTSRCDMSHRGYNNIVSKIEEIVLKIVMEKENIDKEEILKRYFEYVNSFQSIEFRYGRINMVLFKHKQDKSLDRCSFYGDVLNIPVSIKVYCLCLGISVNQHHEYNIPDTCTDF